MLLRRLSHRTLGLATLAIAFVFCIYLYFDIHSQLKLTEERNQRLTALQHSLSTQLQVVYEHKSRLERAIQDEKDNHHKTKEAKQDLEMKLNHEKQELQSRFQTVNQKQRILQSQFDDLQKEMSKTEAEYELLKSEHQREIDEYREKLMVQSQQCDTDRKYLNIEITELKNWQREISENLAKCQESLKEGAIHGEVKRHNNDVPHDALQDVNQAERLGVNRSETSRQHRERLQVDSFKVADNGDAGVDGLQQKLIQKSELQKKENLRVEDAAFQPEENRLARLRRVTLSPIKKPVIVEDVNQFQAARPPAALHGKPEQREGGADSALPDRLVWKRDPGIGVNPAVIQAPDGMEGNRHDSNQRLDAEEDREEMGEKNGPNEGGDQKEEEDYQYDKNADDDDDKNEDNKVDAFPDAKVANKILNKIQNPVYPDDVDVANQ